MYCCLSPRLCGACLSSSVSPVHPCGERHFLAPSRRERRMLCLPSLRVCVVVDSALLSVSLRDSSNTFSMSRSSLCHLLSSLSPFLICLSLFLCHTSQRCLSMGPQYLLQQHLSKPFLLSSSSISLFSPFRSLCLLPFYLPSSSTFFLYLSVFSFSLFVFFPFLSLFLFKFLRLSLSLRNFLSFHGCSLVSLSLFSAHVSTSFLDDTNRDRPVFLSSASPPRDLSLSLSF